MGTSLCRLKTTLFAVAASWVVLGSVFGCSPLQVRTAEAPGVDFTQYRTYAWAARPATPIPGGAVRPPRTILDQTIESSVDSQLQERGLTRSPVAESADLWVGSRVANGPSPRPATYGNYGWDWGGLAPDPERAGAGTLQIQLIDPRANKVVWSGTATGLSPTSEQPQVAQAIKEIFTRSPIG